MVSIALLPDSSALRLEGVSFTEDQAVVVVSSSCPTSTCPSCGRSGSRIHSWYLRTLQDLPWQGKPTVIRWRSRKFFCDSPGCPRRIFTERLPSITWSYGRRSVRAREILECLGLALGGENGCRVATRMGMPISGDTVLRVVRRAMFPAFAAPRIIGVDDWAVQRGHHYGTIIVDLERNQPIELLPDRKWETFRDWLGKHPEVEVVARDRADYYARGATVGAPDAVQVVDRWHLLKNLREALKHSAERFPKEIAEAATEVLSIMNPPIQEPSEVPANTALPQSVPHITVNSLRDTRRSQRMERYQRVHDLRSQGKAIRDIARTLHLSRNTVRRFLRTTDFPERASRRDRRDIAPFADYLKRRWAEGCHNAATLMQEVVKQGFRGSYSTMRRILAPWRAQQTSIAAHCHDPIASGSVGPPSANRVAWLLFLRAEELDDEDIRLVEAIRRRCPQLDKAADLSQDFTELFKKRSANGFGDWIERASGTEVIEDLRQFALGLVTDRPAIEAALTLPWSNGQTEGQVNRLKVLKREMYGRAKLDLLSQRFLHPVK
jgi:transposase